jgi:6-phosphogluconolactonase (cycloisomerase 2 family)
MTRDRSAYVGFAGGSLDAVAAPAGGGAATMLFRVPPWYVPNWARLSPDGRTLYTFSRDQAGEPVYWAVDLRTGVLRKLVTFDHSETRTVRGVSDTDGKRFYFVAGEHQADIWVAEVGNR